MESVVERLTVLHDELDEVISSAPERWRDSDGCEVLERVPNIMLTLGKPRDVRQAMRQANSEFMRARYACSSLRQEIRRALDGARSLRDSVTAEALTEQVTTVRARLASVPSDGVQRVLDAAETDLDAWAALHQVNSSWGSWGAWSADEIESEVPDLKERLDRQFAERARLVLLAKEKRSEYYQLAGVPEPEW